MIDDKSTPGRLSNLLAIAFVADQTLGPLSELLFQVREDCLAVVLVFGFLFVVMADDRSSPVHADLFPFQGCGIVANCLTLKQEKRFKQKCFEINQRTLGNVTFSAPQMKFL